MADTKPITHSTPEAFKADVPTLPAYKGPRELTEAPVEEMRARVAIMRQRAALSGVPQYLVRQWLTQLHHVEQLRESLLAQIEEASGVELDRQGLADDFADFPDGFIPAQAFPSGDNVAEVLIAKNGTGEFPIWRELHH